MSRILQPQSPSIFFRGTRSSPNVLQYALVTRAETERVLGKLPVPPYQASKNSALVFGSGASCAYYSGKHRALVITPMLRHGAEFFKMMGGVNALVASKTGGTQAPDTLEGKWDALSIGSDGALHALKGDEMLTAQYRRRGPPSTKPSS